MTLQNFSIKTKILVLLIIGAIQFVVLSSISINAFSDSLDMFTEMKSKQIKLITLSSDISDLLRKLKDTYFAAAVSRMDKKTYHDETNIILSQLKIKFDSLNKLSKERGFESLKTITENIQARTSSLSTIGNEMVMFYTSNASLEDKSDAMDAYNAVSLKEQIELNTLIKFSNTSLNNNIENFGEKLARFKIITIIVSIASIIALIIVSPIIMSNISRSLKFQESLFDNNSVAIFIVNQQRNIVSANAHFYEAFGYTPQEIINQNAMKIHLDEASFNSFREYYLAALGNDKNVKITYKFKMKDGTLRWFDIMGSSVELSNGETGVLWAMVDVTEIKHVQKELEEQKNTFENLYYDLQSAKDQLVQSEKMASLGGLVAGVAHEINTPVGMALTGVTHVELETKRIRNLYQADEMTEDDFMHFLDGADELNHSVVINLNKAAELIRSFKQVAVDQSSESSRTFNLKEYIEEVLTSLHNNIKKTKLSINVDIDEKLNITSIPGAISQIITNFIMNSIIHGFEHGAEGKINIFAKIENSMLEIIYSDNGKGMDENTVAKVFDPFFTTKRHSGGSGLGMNIVYNIVTQKLNGTISCESSLGSGVSFKIRMPLNQA